MDRQNTIKCCYFGIYEKLIARDKVLLDGLEENGVKIIYCIDSSWFVLKFFQLVIKHWKLRYEYDFMLVGYLSNVVTPLARIISRKKVIYNAGHSMYEGIVLDRKECKPLSLKGVYRWLIDFLAFHSAHVSLVESLSQKKFLINLFKIKGEKLKVTLTGASDKIFHPNPLVKKQDEFCVVFRGQFLPATGVEYVIEAANILKNKKVRFLIMGRGMLKKKVREMIQRFSLKNVELITEYLSEDVLRSKMLSCHVILGQFADHSRMERTIQNKTFEALALGMPYITRDSKSNREILHDRENCLFVRPADADDLAEKILELKNNSELREKIAENGYKLYKEKLTPKVLGKRLLDIFTKSV